MKIRDVAGLAGAGAVIAGAMVAAVAFVAVIGMAARALSLRIGLSEMRMRIKKGKE